MLIPGPETALKHWDTKVPSFGFQPRTNTIVLLYSHLASFVGIFLASSIWQQIHVYSCTYAGLTHTFVPYDIGVTSSTHECVSGPVGAHGVSPALSSPPVAHCDPADAYSPLERAYKWIHLCTNISHKSKTDLFCCCQNILTSCACDDIRYDKKEKGLTEQKYCAPLCFF